MRTYLRALEDGQVGVIADARTQPTATSPTQRSGTPPIMPHPLRHSVPSNDVPLSARFQAMSLDQGSSLLSPSTSSVSSLSTDGTKYRTATPAYSDQEGNWRAYAIPQKLTQHYSLPNTRSRTAGSEGVARSMSESLAKREEEEYPREVLIHRDLDRSPLTSPAQSRRRSKVKVIVGDPPHLPGYPTTSRKIRVAETTEMCSPLVGLASDLKGIDSAPRTASLPHSSQSSPTNTTHVQGVRSPFSSTSKSISSQSRTSTPRMQATTVQSPSSKTSTPKSEIKAPTSETVLQASTTAAASPSPQGSMTIRGSKQDNAEETAWSPFHSGSAGLPIEINAATTRFSDDARSPRRSTNVDLESAQGLTRERSLMSSPSTTVYGARDDPRSPLSKGLKGRPLAEM